MKIVFEHLNPLTNFSQFLQILSPLINIMITKYLKLFFAHYEHYPSFKY